MQEDVASAGGLMEMTVAKILDSNSCEFSEVDRRW